MSSATAETTRKVARSKYGTDIMFRIWDSHNSTWVKVNGRSIWSSKGIVDRIIKGLIEKGRSPETLTRERVFVEIK